MRKSIHASWNVIISVLCTGYFKQWSDENLLSQYLRFRSRVSSIPLCYVMLGFEYARIGCVVLCYFVTYGESHGESLESGCKEYWDVPNAALRRIEILRQLVVQRWICGLHGFRCGWSEMLITLFSVLFYSITFY